MYLEHFGLREAPFRITPHTEFFFAGANRGATLDALIYAITHDEGIVKVSGEVGSGKTMLCRVLMERLPEHVVTIYLANPSLSRDDILYALADELQLEIPPKARTAFIIRMLQDHLIGLYGEGRQVVVLIDEAHAMPADTLEEIRLLSNLESNRHKLLQLVLFGQPELNDILGRSDMRQLKERITHNFLLEPLIRADIADYVEFRLRAAGYKGPNVFSPAAINLITRASLGLTRRINILSDKALLAAFAANSHEITPTEVKAAIKDCDFSPAVQPWQKITPWAIGSVGLVVLAIVAYLIAKNDSPAAPAPITVASTATISTPISNGTSTKTPPAAPTANPIAEVSSKENKPLAQQNIQTNPAASSPIESATKAQASNEPKLGKLTQERYNASLKWLAVTPDEHWFIQLLATDAKSTEHVENFINKNASAISVDDIRVYVANTANGQRIGVIYGDYASRELAIKDIGKLPVELQNFKPYPRQVKRLR